MQIGRMRMLGLPNAKRAIDFLRLSNLRRWSAFRPHTGHLTLNQATTCVLIFIICPNANLLRGRHKITAGFVGQDAP